MGTLNQIDDTEFSFKPKINAKSRKLAAQQKGALGIVYNGTVVPHFMLGTTRIGYIYCDNQNETGSYLYTDTTRLKRPKHSEYTVEHLDLELSQTAKDSLTADVPQSKKFKSLKRPKSCTGVRRLSSDPEFDYLSTVFNTMPEREQDVSANVDEQNTFTFKPKASPHSLKIAETLTTDFMTRQQQHLDKQRKLVSHTALCCIHVHLLIYAMTNEHYFKTCW